MAKRTSTTRKAIGTKSEIDIRKIELIILVMSADMIFRKELTDIKQSVFALALVVWR